MVETPSGMLKRDRVCRTSAVESFVREKLPWLRERGANRRGELLGNTVEEYGDVGRRARVGERHRGARDHISSYDKREWGRIIATDRERTAEVVRTARARTRRPLWVKLSPNVTDITRVRPRGGSRGGRRALGRQHLRRHGGRSAEP